MGLFKPKLRADIQAKLNRPGVRAFISVPCVAGLPVPDRTLSQIYCFDDFVEIVSNGVEYNLRMDKIQSVSIQMNGYTQTQYVSSTGGAILGAAVAGPLGAAIGGRVKEKNQTTFVSCLVFSYFNKDGELTYIAFDVSHTPKAKTVVQHFENIKKDRGASNPIEL